MKELSLWFVYKHYTECFSHIKKCASHKLDASLDPSDLLIIQNLDHILRETSYISAIISGFLTSSAVALFVSINLNSEIHKNWIVFKALIGLGVMLNINKIMDTSSHIGLMLSIPRAFQVLDEGLSEGCIVRKYNLEFYQEFSQDIDKVKDIE